MIVVDIETSGNLYPHEIGIWQIGAIEIENPENTFLQEGRIDDEDKVEPEALTVTGKTEEDLRDKNKQSQKQLLENFFEWALNIENKVMIAHNTPFDFGFLSIKARKYGLKFPFKHRSFDLHAFAAFKYFQINRNFLSEDGHSALNLTKILEFCGMKDNRIIMKEHNVLEEGTPHNGLEDAKLEAECFYRIIYGKNLLPEFEKDTVPKYLRKL